MPLFEAVRARVGRLVPIPMMSLQKGRKLPYCLLAMLQRHAKRTRGYIRLGESVTVDQQRVRVVLRRWGQMPAVNPPLWIEPRRCPGSSVLSPGPRAGPIPPWTPAPAFLFVPVTRAPAPPSSSPTLVISPSIPVVSLAVLAVSPLVIPSALIPETAIVVARHAQLGRHIAPGRTRRSNRTGARRTGLHRVVIPIPIPEWSPR